MKGISQGRRMPGADLGPDTRAPVHESLFRKWIQGSAPAVAVVPKVTIGLTSDFRHRKTIRPLEQVRLIPQRDLDDIVQSYNLDTAQVGHHIGEATPSLVNPVTGQSESPSSTYDVVDGTTSDPYKETEHTFSQGSVTTHLWGSERGNSVTRWRTVIGSPHNLDVEWLCRDGPNGLGSGISGSDRWFEYFLTVGANQHNPTHGGSTSLPSTNAGFSKTMADQLLTVVSPQLYYNVDSSSITGAVVPLEFDPDGSDTPTFNTLFFDPFPGLWANPHGGEHDGTKETRTVLFWRNKRLERVEPHFGSREYLHREIYWHYQPLAWDPTDFGGSPTLPGTVRLRCEIAAQAVTLMQGIGLDTLHYADIGSDSPQLVEIPEYRTGITSSFGRIQFSNSFTRFFGDIAKPDEATRFPSGYLMLVISRSTDGFAIGVLCKLSTINSGPIGRDVFPNIITVLRVANPRVYPGTPQPPDAGQGHEHIITTATSSVLGRDAGWSGFNIHVFTGPLSEAITAGQEAVSSGILDDAADTNVIPASVRSGTELATAGQATVNVTSSLTANGQGASIGGSGLGIFVDPADRYWGGSQSMSLDA